MKYLQFARLCWQAYNGDVGAALQVITILKERAGV